MTAFNSSVVMSDALHFSADQAINPYYDDSAVDTTIATAEHNEIQRLLELSGVRVHTVPSPATSQDGVYTANWALVRGDTAVLARLPDVRKSEQDYAEVILTNLGKRVVHVPAGLKFSGQGDALPCGDYLFCGGGYRSDEAAQQFAAETLGYQRIQLRTIPERDASGRPMNNPISGWPDSFFYDIDLALAVIKVPTDGQKGLIAYCPEAFTPESQKLLHEFDAVDKIIVSIDEARSGFACNLVSTGQAVVMSADAPLLRQSLEQHGLTVHTPGISELAKGGGYIRCTTLTID